jgi:hypothetical protein
MQYIQQLRKVSAAMLMLIESFLLVPLFDTELFIQLFNTDPSPLSYQAKESCSDILHLIVVMKQLDVSLH